MTTGALAEGWGGFVPGSGSIILWDVDGTLVRAGGVGRTAFITAFQQVMGIDVSAHQADLGGKTDPQIALEILGDLGIDEPGARLGGVLTGLQTALAALESEMRAKGWILPGVAKVVESLAQRPNVIQTLVTGNMKANARLKLDAFGLGAGIEFDLGAYGDDHADRTKLVPVALGRLAEAGVIASPERTWVVGDTARDLACARAGGVRCLLVATGTRAFSELRNLGADAVLEDLSDVETVAAMLTGVA